jgi:sugar phosphate permease
LSLVCSGLGLVVGALMIVDLTSSTSYSLLIASYTIFGIGFGVVNPPITNAAVSGMPRSQAGVAAAFASTSRQIGASLGVAVIGSLVNAGTGGQVGTGLVSRSHVAEIVVACCGAAVLLLGVITTTSWARRSADRSAAELGDASVEAAPAHAEAEVAAA